MRNDYHLIPESPVEEVVLTQAAQGLIVVVHGDTPMDDYVAEVDNHQGGGIFELRDSARQLPCPEKGVIRCLDDRLYLEVYCE